MRRTITSKPITILGVLAVLTIGVGSTGAWAGTSLPSSVVTTGTKVGDPLGWQAIDAALNDPRVPWTLCAQQGKYCPFEGTKMVRYGLPGKYAYGILKNGVKCTNRSFANDPLPGTTKYCAYRSWPPAAPSQTVPVAGGGVTAAVPATTPPATLPPATTPPATTPAKTPTIATTTSTTTTTPASATIQPVGQSNIIPSNFDTSPYIAAGGTIPPSSAGDPSGNFRFLCDFSHLSYNDPIVYPGQPGAAHLHMFFGNTATDASSTYQSLRAAGNSTCQGGPLNRSAYWTPALLNAAGQVVVPDFIAMYYKDGVAAQVGVPVAEIPRGLKMIAGYDMAAPSTATHFSWYCETNQIKQQAIPHCADNERVGVTLSFPSCWDGVNLDSANHRSHLAYFSYVNGAPKCPATHPVYIPEVTMSLWYTHHGDSQTWSLSSDKMPGMTHANGTTFHADWMGAWDPTIQTQWLRNCINGLRSCSGGQLGDGRWLIAPPAYTGPIVLAAPVRA